MIQNFIKSDVETIGDIQSNKVQIDSANLDFITQILSSNLYSQPLQSFLREILSNAVDSHKEAGTTDPVILDIGVEGSKPYIRIQDFGTGISPERFDKIYRYIGSSTKRESNEYIGYFGLGRFASLSVSDSCFITSCYEGIKTKYAMYKDGLSIKIDQISSVKTDEHNGVEVLVYISDLSRIYETLYMMQLFEGVYLNVDYRAISYYVRNDLYKYSPEICIDTFNNKINQTYKTFSLCKYLSNSYSNLFVSVGGVIYPINESYLPEKFKLFREQISYNWSIVPTVPIGSVTMTPNREQLLYNTETVRVIRECFENAWNEIKEYVSSSFDEDVSTNLIWFGQLIKEDSIAFKLATAKGDTVSLTIKPEDFTDTFTVFNQTLKCSERQRLGQYLNSITIAEVRNLKQPYHKNFKKPTTSDYENFKAFRYLIAQNVQYFTQNGIILKGLIKAYLADQYSYANVALLKFVSKDFLLNLFHKTFRKETRVYRRIAFELWKQAVKETEDISKLDIPDWFVTEYEQQKGVKEYEKINYPFSRLIGDTFKRCRIQSFDDFKKGCIVIGGTYLEETLLTSLYHCKELLKWLFDKCTLPVYFIKFNKGCEGLIESCENGIMISELFTDETILQRYKVLYDFYKEGSFKWVTQLENCYVYAKKVFGGQIIDELLKISRAYTDMSTPGAALFNAFISKVETDEGLKKTFEEYQKYGKRILLLSSLSNESHINLVISIFNCCETDNLVKEVIDCNGYKLIKNTEENSTEND